MSGLDILIPFAIVAALTLLIMGVVRMAEKYEPPTSIKDSARRIAASAGSTVGGFAIATLILGGATADRFWGALLGFTTAALIMLAIDIIVLRHRTRRDPN